MPMIRKFSRPASKLVQLTTLSAALAALLGIATCTVGQTPTAIGSITIAGAERYSAGVWDTGTATATINGLSVQVPYGEYSTPASLAAGVAAKISSDCSLPVFAHAVGAVVSFYPKGTDLVSSATFTSKSNNPTAFPSSSFLVDGTGAGGTVPTISLSPSSGPAGSALTISGTAGINFGTSKGTMGMVSFGGTTAATSSWSATSIALTVPNLDVGIYEVDVTPGSGGVSSLGGVFTVTPLVTGLSFDNIDVPIPESNIATSLSGPPLVGFLIVGGNFGANDLPEDTYVTLNGTELTTTAWSDTQITVQVPADFSPGGPYSLAVVVSGIASANAINFTVSPALGCTAPQGAPNL